MFPEAWKSGRLAADFRVETTAPANIAWVKYWGKKGPQLPANPSLSLTLSQSRTHTTLEATSASDLRLELWFQGTREEKFEAKTLAFLASLAAELPALGHAHYKITSRNTFPHSSGIASSASSQAALALALGELLTHVSGGVADSQAVGSIARLGSGSACRSLHPGIVSWGETPLIKGSSDLHATDVTSHVHANFQGSKDCILIVSSKEKSVSSRAGHGQMTAHPYAQARFAQANAHMSEMWSALVSGDWQKAGDVMEADALSLHALMMTSRPGFVLLEAGSLEIMRLVRLFRQESQVPVYFTIDAGPNMHLIYPHEAHAKVEAFVRHELLRFTENGSGVIWDGMGTLS
jgi:diphosphomevalonate decarboxylase